MKIILFLLLNFAFAAAGQVGSVVHYTFLGDSQLTEDCPICGRPIVPQPVRGGFDLMLIEQNPIASRYIVTNLIGYSGAKTNPEIRLTGSGVYEITGQLAVQQRMVLDLSMWSSATQTNESITFTNRESSIKRPFPLLEVFLDETTPTLVQVFTFNIMASPLRDIWFSVATNGAGGTSGDLISYTTGRFLNRLELQQRLTSTFPFDIDAFEAKSNGEFYFSLKQGFQSFQEGDVISWKQLTRVHRNQDLTLNLGIMPVRPDLGLDAYFEKNTNEIWFSSRTNIYSEQLDQLNHGDILSSAGAVIARNNELLGLFSPAITNVDFGLDALYAWPHGELWFSTSTGFISSTLGSIQSGDLLSNYGYIVFRNHDLLENVFRQEQPIDFGLDALHVITGEESGAGQGSLFRPEISGRDLLLNWTGEGVAFQLFKAAEVTGPYQELSPMMPRTSYRDTGALTNSSHGFYLLRQW